MAMTTYEQGQLEGQRILLRELLEDRFGALSPLAAERLAALSAEQLLDLGKALLTAKSLEALGLEG